jgi:K+/H+ antiporter YhaU regulatory subunit KhtT
MKHSHSQIRRLRAAWRDTALLLRAFRAPLLLFAVVVVGGCAYFYLAGLSVSQIERSYDVSVVLLRHANGRDLHPPGDKRIAANDTIAVLGGHEQINRLAQDNK